MTSPPRPPPTRGMHHVALCVDKLEECVRFYVDLMGMGIEWQPDPDNVYLSSGSDNLALHRAQGPLAKTGQCLDHIGFIVAQPEDVDAWHAFLAIQAIVLLTPPRTHRDGARSFYCLDPAKNKIQIIFHPPLVLQ